jgi:uncharacterized membrane protein
MATVTVFQFEAEDGAIVTWPLGWRKPKTKHLSQLAGIGTLNGAFWSTLFGVIFFVPFFGMPIASHSTQHAAVL